MKLIFLIYILSTFLLNISVLGASDKSFLYASSNLFPFLSYKSSYGSSLINFLYFPSNLFPLLYLLSNLFPFSSYKTSIVSSFIIFLLYWPAFLFPFLKKSFCLPNFILLPLFLLQFIYSYGSNLLFNFPGIGLSLIPPFTIFPNLSFNLNF